MWYKDTGLIPQSGWVYKDPDTGMTRKGSDYKDLIDQAVKHRGANKLPVDKSEEIVNDWLCSNNPPNFCTEIRGAGDVVYRVLHPIAKVIDRVAGTNVRGCSGCARRRAALNRAIPF